jgi:hypothetical protein
MNQQEAYDHGKANGYTAASYLDDEEVKDAVENLYDADFISEHGLDKGDLATNRMARMAHIWAAWDNEENARQYSPFEVFAHEINMSGNRAEGLWEKYEDGVRVGINQGVREYLGLAVLDMPGSRPR